MYQAETIMSYAVAKNMNQKNKVTSQDMEYDQEQSMPNDINEQSESIPTQNELEIMESDDYDLKTCHTIWPE